MKANNVEMSILIGNHNIREYLHEGKTYVEGRKGSAFTIRLRNYSPKRLLVVTSVDGLDVISGKTANWDSQGYVIDPYKRLEIEGWRTSETECAEFIFDSKGCSYASSSGKPANVGVIGCAIFEEKANYYWYPCNSTVTIRNDPWMSGTTTCYNSNSITYTASNFGPETFDTLDLNVKCSGSAHKRSRQVEQPVQNIGVGFGEAVEHAVTEVNFEKATTYPACTMTIYYDDRNGLIAKGVLIKDCHKVSSPNPFPANSNYCKPPKSWKRK
jgi:hypothetical protein